MVNLTHNIKMHSKSSGSERMTLGLETTTRINYIFPAVLFRNIRMKFRI